MVSRRFGLTVDHVVGVEMVMGNGRRVRVFDPAHERDVTGTGPTWESVRHQELLWAVRGSGHGNFGVVTKYWFRTVKQPGWMVVSTTEYATPTGAEAVHFFKAFCTYYSRADASRNLIVWPMFYPGTEGTLLLRMFYVAENGTVEGALAEAGPVLQGYLSHVPGTPLNTSVTYPVPFEAFYQGVMAKAVPVNYDCVSRAVMRAEDMCGDEAHLAAMAEKLAEESKVANWQQQGHMMFAYIEPWGGAIAEADPLFQKTSFGIRHAWGNFQYCRMTQPGTPTSATLPKLTEWNAELARMSNASYINYVDRFVESHTRLYPVPDVFTRLQHVKTRYDSRNAFHWQWSVPVHSGLSTDDL